jgi:hypothetical protein
MSARVVSMNFCLKKFIEIVSRTLHITRNISKHPNEKVGILNETKQLSVSFFIDLKPDDNSISKMLVRVVSMNFCLKKSIEIVSRTLHITRNI